MTRMDTPPARDDAELFQLIQDAGGDERLVEMTDTWLAFGRRSRPRIKAIRNGMARNLSWWLRWCQLHGITPQAARPIDADQFRSSLGRTELSSSTVVRMLATCSSWYTYAVRVDLVSVNPFKGMLKTHADQNNEDREGG